MLPGSRTRIERYLANAPREDRVRHMERITPRMQKLEARLVMLGNYNFLDTLSPPVKQEDVIRDVNGMLKAAFFDDNGILVRPCPGKDLSGVEVMVAEVYARVHGDELYQKLLKAYRADNQPYIADVATSVFSSIRRVRNPGCLVHGVRITQGMTPEEYVDLGTQAYIDATKEGGVIYDLKSVLDKKLILKSGRKYLAL